jgi:hypothetical protein
MTQIEHQQVQAAFLQGEITAGFWAGSLGHGLLVETLPRSLWPTVHTGCGVEDLQASR